MPKVKRSNKKPPPDGWELIEPTLEELEQKMREGKKTIIKLYYLLCNKKIYVAMGVLFYLWS